MIIPVHNSSNFVDTIYNNISSQIFKNFEVIIVDDHSQDNTREVSKEKVIVQTGFSTYVPKHCEAHKMMSFDEMQHTLKDARIVITHGGPSSFIEALQYGKVPIVVPRQEKFHEHVNNHQ
ncbi:glycosyltransferase, partial [Lactobacillus helveticus]|uniref:glycosyltransferase n=1 Tax=Lactobacillus helveticus TaxID=1587 RepID=UPI001C251F7D